MRPARVDESAEPADPRDDTMPDEEITDEIIMGFLRFVKNGIEEEFTDSQIEALMDMYMRSRMAGG